MIAGGRLESPAMPSRHNNFDLLRLLFAGSVALWHAYDLSRSPALAALSSVASAELGVKSFFVVSGFLVVMSCENSRSLREYAAKRVRRIYPAYFAVVVGCAVLGVLVSRLSASEYFSADVLRYLAANLLFLNFLAPGLPGVFEGNPWREVNGALWTLKVEVMFYAAVPLLVAAYRRVGAPLILVLLYVASVGYSLGLGAMAEASGRPFYLQLQRQLPGQLTYFLAGAALYLYREHAFARWKLLLWVAVAAGAVQHAVFPPLSVLVEPVWLGIIVIYGAYGLPYLGNFARFGDLSYGLYIFHFPVIQVLVAAGYFERAPFAGLLTAMATSLALAYLSWHLVERRFLGRRSHYRLAEAKAG